MNPELRILLLEDTATDAELIQRALRQEGLQFTALRVETEADYKEQLRQFAPDLILSDYNLPTYNGLFALAERQRMCPGVPFIFVSGQLGEEAAIDALKLGATDYVLKQRLGRLGPAVRRAAQELDEHQQRQRAEAALRENQARLARAESFSHIMVTHLALDGRWLKVPPLLCRLLGYTEAELLTRTIRDVTPPEVAAAAWNQYERLRGSDLQSFSADSRFQRKDGQVLWFSASTALVTDAQGQPLQFLTYLRDITENIRAFEQVRAQAHLLDLTPDAILVCDLAGQIRYWNRGAQTLYGWSAEEAIGQHAGALLASASAELAPCLERVLSVGYCEGEPERRTRGGQKLRVQSRWSLMRQPSGAPQSVLVVETDITDKKNLEAQFLRAQRLESIGRLAAGVAHDLNNILTPVLMWAKVLQSEPSLEVVRKRLATIERSAVRGADIVKQLLVFGRRAGRPRAAISARPLVEELRKIVEETFPKNLRFESHLPADLWDLVGDATQLHQVLLNLCVNARDAMPEGGLLAVSADNVWLDERTARQYPGAQAGACVRLSVADTGHGIPREISDKIFDPFFTTKGTGKGSGLGLATALGIVQSHNGFINVRSEPGQGSVFEVYLPATPEAEVPAPAGATDVPGGPKDVASKAGSVGAGPFRAGAGQRPGPTVMRAEPEP